MNLRALASGLAVVALWWTNPSIREDESEEIRSSFLQFVERVNALSNSVTTDMWSSVTVDRLKVLESADANGFLHAYMVVGATIAVEESDVVFHDSHRAIVVAKRAVKLRQKDGTPGETTHDSILAVMRCRKRGHWCVAYQVAMPQEEKFEHGSPNESPSQIAARAALERILRGITTGDRQAVDAAVSTRTGRTLSGEIGRYLVDSKKRETDCYELQAVACSDQTCVFQGEISSFEISSGSTKSAGTGRSALSVLVFRRGTDKSWRLDGELVYAD